MFIDPVFNHGKMDALLRVIAGTDDITPEKIDTGRYQIKHYSFDCLISKDGGNLRGDDDWVEYPDVPDFPNGEYCNSYGVCDSYEQFMEDYGFLLEQDSAGYCMSFNDLKKAEQPSSGGWRWRKWGPYIGRKEPKMEYLYDEPEIDGVTIFHIYRRKS